MLRCANLNNNFQLLRWNQLESAKWLRLGYRGLLIIKQIHLNNLLYRRCLWVNREFDKIGFWILELFQITFRVFIIVAHNTDIAKILTKFTFCSNFFNILGFTQWQLQHNYVDSPQTLISLVTSTWIFPLKFNTDFLWSLTFLYILCRWESNNIYFCVLV